eukprot:5753598-Prymnesium_polylepis.1
MSAALRASTTRRAHHARRALSSMPPYLQGHSPLSAERLALRETMRRFVDAEIIPNIGQWERDRQVPRSLYAKAGQAGLLGVAMPEDYGGVGGGILSLIDFCDELSRAGSGGVLAALGSHQIALPPIFHTASEELKARVLPPVIAGEKIAALAITEPGVQRRARPSAKTAEPQTHVPNGLVPSDARRPPARPCTSVGGGSDVAGLRTTAVRDGDHFIVSGEKTFITSGVQADFITAAVRTGGEGAQGVSLLLIEPAVTAGLTATKLDKMGWHCSDTAHLHFDGCRVPCKRARTRTGARARSVDAHGCSNPATVGSCHCERRVGLTAAVLSAARARQAPT